MNELKSEVKTPPPKDAGRHRFWRHLSTFGKWLVEREEMPSHVEKRRSRGTEPTTIGWLVSADSLADRADSPSQRQEFFAWLAPGDPLPSLPASPRRRHNFFSWLTSREHLPTYPSDITPVRRFFLRWLLTLDPHERLESHLSTKEVAPHEP